MSVAPAERIEIEVLARRYFAGQLSEAEANALEHRVLENPELAREVDLTRRFRAGLGELQRSGRLEPLLHWLPASRLRVQFAAAAAVMIVIVASLVYFTRPSPATAILATSIESLRPGVLVSGTYLVALRRSGDDSITIPLPRPREALRLNILPAMPAATDRYRVELREAGAGAGSEPLATVAGSAGDQGLVSVLIDTSHLQAGRYVLTLKPSGKPVQPAGATSYPLTFSDAAQN
jgi:hypothetical protein